MEPAAQPGLYSYFRRLEVAVKDMRTQKRQQRGELFDWSQTLDLLPGFGRWADTCCKAVSEKMMSVGERKNVVQSSAFQTISAAPALQHSMCLTETPLIVQECTGDLLGAVLSYFLAQSHNSLKYEQRPLLREVRNNTRFLVPSLINHKLSDVKICCCFGVVIQELD